MVRGSSNSVGRNALILVLFTCVLQSGLSYEYESAPGVYIRDVNEGVSETCTTTISGRLATDYGSPLISYTNDCKQCDSRISKVPAKTHDAEARRKVIDERLEYPRYIGKDRGTTYFPQTGEDETPARTHIDEVSETYGFIDSTYGIMNEHGLGMGESTCNSRIKVTNTSEAYFTIAELSRIGLERCKTAVCAIKLMGKLAFEHGFYEPENSGGETLTVMDQTDAWVFHVTGTPDGKSAVWCARRVPEDHIVTVANFFTIGELDLEDGDNYLASNNVFDVAEGLGFWKRGTKFHFADVYGGENKIITYTARRVWRVYSLVAPSLKLPAHVKKDSEYPWSVKPEAPISVEFLQKINRDHYEGTEFDLTKGLAAGPWGTPTRVEFKREKGEPLFERPICMHRTAYSTILQSRKDVHASVGGIAWIGLDAPHSSCYVPIYAGVQEVPKSYASGHILEFNTKSAWWAFDFLSNYILDNHFSKMLPFVAKAQTKYERGAEEEDKKIVEHVKAMVERKAPKGEIDQYLTEKSKTWAERVVNSWWEMSGYLAVKFNDNYNNIPAIGSPEPYPKDWMQRYADDEYRRSHPRMSQLFEALVPGIIGIAIGIMVSAIGYAAVVTRNGNRKRQGYQPI
eukprot:Nk52_evm22s2640 gene=Nk52_evmTU22s2640